MICMKFYWSNHNDRSFKWLLDPICLLNKYQGIICKYVYKDVLNPNSVSQVPLGYNFQYLPFEFF